MLALRDLPQPVIAEVQGTAVAAGCQLVASCDLAVAAEHARFGVNGVNIGLFCSTPMVALTRAIPRKAAFEMLTTGRLIGAEEARTLGLVNRVVPADTLTAETMALADSIASKLGRALRIGKQAFHAQAEMTTAEAYAYTGAAMTENMAAAHAKHGIRINAILPGLMNTPMAIENRVAKGQRREDVVADRDSRIPLKGKQGTGWDVAHAALFLHSEEASFITGVTLVVDGGETIAHGH
jgi:NAD(P)-dependent dehydrogenase (short-subunit alcohol dehydrogenase family)